MKRLLALISFLLLFAAAHAHAQTPVYQNGSITNGHPAGWVANRFVGDLESQGGFSQLTLTASTPTFCINDAVTTGAYHQVCFGANNSSSQGILQYSAFGGASTQPWVFNVNTGQVSINQSALTAGLAGTYQGTVLLCGATSGCVTLKVGSAAGTYNWFFPTTAGTLGQIPASGAGSAAMTWDSPSGNTSTLMTGSGPFPTNDCPKFDASGNIVDSGGSCGASGVTSSTGGQVAWYSTTGQVVVGNADLTMSGAALSVGRAATSQGSVTLNAAGGGGVTDAVPASVTSYTITKPSAVPAAGQTMYASNGTGTMAWGNPSVPLCCTYKTTNFNASPNIGYCVDTTSGAITVTLEAAPATNDNVALLDCAGTWATNNVTVARNGNSIMNLAQNMTISTNYANPTLSWDSHFSSWNAH